MPGRVQFRSNVVRRSKRQTDWMIAVRTTGPVAIASGAKVVIGQATPALLVGLTPSTIVRTRGILEFHTDNLAATESQSGCLGVGIVNEQAQTVGVTALPGPETDPLWEGWFVLQPFRSHTSINTAVGFDAPGGRMLDVDSKAMRKLDSSDGLVIMVENNSGSFAFDIQLYLRFLLKK